MEREFYGEYLRWFRSRAADGIEPRDMDELFHTFLFSRTAYRCAAYVLDEAYFITWIEPKESKAGIAAWFLFAETDKILLDEFGDVCDEASQRTYKCIAQI